MSKNKKPSIGDRMKRYEAAYDPNLTPRMPLFVRVDGRSFHTFLRKATKPFDLDFIGAMAVTACFVAKQMQGFKLAYVQSDECTFCLTDYDDHATQGWFDYKLNKVVSLSAAHFSVMFNNMYPTETDALFDSRAFVVPVDDAPNVFVWRQRDWERNSVQMLARAHFSHKQCHEKRIPDLHEMLHEVGVNWAHLQPQLKNGTFLTPRWIEGLTEPSEVDGVYPIHQKLDYETIAELVHPQVTEPV